MKNIFVRLVLTLLTILTCASGQVLAQQHPPLEFADDLAAVGKLAAARQVPIMLVFTQSDCQFCTRAKQEHLEPLQASPAYGAKVIIREIEAGNAKIALRDFDGSTTTHADFTRKYDVQSVPTVIVVDERGRTLSGPIVGLLSADFYNLYLERAIDEGRLQLRTRQ